mmetsp:Transcript_1770/g.3816  ORF Transcript_1770/g.3816 Transcript_1770/m.3816 type:complete len:413 (-) Transcript_1770:2168-3406(-)
MFARRALNSFRRFSTKKDENWPLLKRELIADVFQNSLKGFAYYVSGSASMKAELMRSVIDASNHLLLYGANSAVIRAAENPEKSIRYEGYDKLKNLVVILPGIFFLCTGAFNVLSPVVYSLLGSLEVDHINLTPLSLSAIVLSSFGEFYLFYKNVGDVLNNEGLKLNLDQSKVSFILGDSVLSFHRRVYNRIKVARALITNKVSIDPIQDIIVTENVLAMMGVSLPILSALGCYLTGLNWIDYLGEMMNGVIQLNLGYLICQENARILLGHGLSDADVARVKGIMENRDEVLGITEFHSEYISSTDVKISARVKYDDVEIFGDVITQLDSDIKAISPDPEIQAKIRQITSRACSLALKSSAEVIEEMEDDIKSQFPNAKLIDLEHGIWSDTEETAVTREEKAVTAEKEEKPH